jgi:hypothetical protein
MSIQATLLARKEVHENGPDSEQENPSYHPKDQSLMSFILSASRDSASYSYDLFTKYLEYLASVKEFFPQSAYLIASDPEWYRFHDHCVHDSRLLIYLVSNEDYNDGSSTTTIKLSLMCLNRKIKTIFYKKVVKYALHQNSDSARGEWRFDEFSLYAPGVFKHTIEWSDGSIWQICAEGMEIEEIS